MVCVLVSCEDVNLVSGQWCVSVCLSDQWSPLNPEGKKQYDRNFMLQLQYVPSSVTRPANLPALPDIILTEVLVLSSDDCLEARLSELFCVLDCRDALM